MTPWIAAHQAPPSTGFSRQEHWSGLPFPSPMHACMLSHFSGIRLCVILWTAAHQAPPSTGFSRQEYWSGLPLPSPHLKLTHYKSKVVHYKIKIKKTHGAPSGSDGKESACITGDPGLISGSGRPRKILCWEDPLEKAMATHSSILTWKIQRMEEPSRLQSMGWKSVRYD